MPQVIALVIVGAGLYTGYKWVSRHMAGLQAKRDAMPKDLGNLEYDAEERVYRPRVK